MSEKDFLVWRLEWEADSDPQQAAEADGRGWRSTDEAGHYPGVGLIEAVLGDEEAGGWMVETAPEPFEADSWQAQAACAAAEAEAAPGDSAGLAEAVREVPEAASGPAEAAPVLLTQ